ncbi:MAG: hypothetical protein Q4P71_05375 [Actinomycetaceae bacterium]|nr:hypothetical protein [Actinomycetaceae bacterium]
MDVSDLMIGPRGRRLLWNYVIASTVLHDKSNVWDAVASHRLKKNLSAVAEAVTRVQPAPLTAETARTLIADTTAAAMYWQEPDDDDRLVVSPQVMSALQPFAESLCSSDVIEWWDTGVDQSIQWEVQWDQSSPHQSAHSSAQILRDWQRATVAAEAWAVDNLPADHRYPFSGTWWSTPPAELLQTTRRLWDGTSAGMWFVEDSAGDEKVRVRPVEISAQRVFEIGSSNDWIYLCRTYPLEVTAHKRHDWYRTTGRVGEWTMPNWNEVASDYDGVHLTVAGYLCVAGRALPTAPDTASVLAGWNPDTTYWLNDCAQTQGEWKEWVVDSHAPTFSWVGLP